MKRRVERCLEQRLALRLRRLDVIAEEVVVLDPELPDSRLVGVSRLHVGDDAAAFVAQAARFVESGERARAHEAAVALDQRQVVGERRGKIARRARRNRGSGRRGALEFRRQPRRLRRAARATAAAAASPSRTAARSRGPPRSRLSRDSARRKSGAPASARRRRRAGGSPRPGSRSRRAARRSLPDWSAGSRAARRAAARRPA